MVTIEELKEEFTVVNVPPYGECIVIPARMFGAAWEQDLIKQGCKIFSGSSEGEAALFVKLPAADKGSQKPRVVYEPPRHLEEKNPQKEREWLKGPNWTQKEDQRLATLVKENLSAGQKVNFQEIAKQFSGRSQYGVKMRIRRLQKKGLLPGTPTRKYKQREKAKAALPTPPQTPSPHVKEEILKELVITLSELVNIVDKLGCQAIMHALEIKELRGKDEFRIPLGLWIHYANALLEDDKKYREVFREKVHKLLEAGA